MKALFIIDMQLGSFKPYSLRHDTMGVIERINKLSAQFRLSGDKIIFIQHDGSKENAFLPGTDDWNILPELDVQPTDIMVSKTANDAFYKTNLSEILSGHDITELFLTGCATDFCIDATIKSALSRDYNITVVADAHTTASRPHIDAETVINHYNWLWADMTPTAHRIEVVPSDSVLLSLSLAMD
jgi:nicotinamidase-related amidase